MQVKLPKVGFSMTEGAISEWYVDDGAQVEKGQLLYAFEAEKAIQEVESPAGGTLKILVEASDDAIEVGTVVAEIS